MSNISNIEPKEGDFYTSHNNFVEAVKEYAKKKGFQVHLGKVEKKQQELFVKELYYVVEKLIQKKHLLVLILEIECHNVATVNF